MRGVTPRLDLSSFSVKHSRRQVGHQRGANASDSPVGAGSALTRQLSRP